MEGQATNGHRDGYESSASPPPASSHLDPVASTDRAGSHSGSVGSAVQPRASYDTLQDGAQDIKPAQLAGLAVEDSDEEGEEVDGAGGEDESSFVGQHDPAQPLFQPATGFAGDEDDDYEEEEEDESEAGDDDYESEHEPLQTAWRRTHKKKENLEPLFGPDDVLTEKEMGSKTVLEIYTMVQKGIIDLNPEYQRDAVWPTTNSAELIDSICRNYYVPHLVYNIISPESDYRDYAICKAEDQVDPSGTARVSKNVMASMDKGKGKEKAQGEPGPGEVVRDVWRCMDGKQRTTAICKFIDGKFQIAGRDKRKYTYETLPDNLRQSFNSRRLYYAFYRDLEAKEEEEVFKRVQKGKGLTKGEIRKATNSAYSRWLQKFLTQYYSQRKLDSFWPRIFDADRGKALDAVMQGSTNVLAAYRDGFKNIQHQSAASRSKILESDDLPTADEQAQVQQMFARFHELSLIPPLRGEDRWPNTPTGRERAADGLVVPHRVWRITGGQVGDKTSETARKKAISVAPIEMHLLPAVIWKFRHLDNGQLLEIIEKLRIHIHKKHRKEVKDNKNLYETIKNWCRNFDPDTDLTRKYRKDGTLRGKPASEQRSTFVSTANNPSTTSSASAAPKKVVTTSKSTTSTSAGKKKKADDPPPKASSSSKQNGTSDKSKGKERSTTSSTTRQRSTSVASQVEFSPGAILPFGSPKASNKPPPDPKPRPPPPVFSLPKPTPRQTPAAPPQPAPSSRPQPALSVKQAKFQNRLNSNLGAAPAPSPVVQKTQAQQIRGLPSMKKRAREDEPFMYDARGRRVPPPPPPPPPAQTGQPYDYGGPGDVEMDLGEMGALDYDAMEREREQTYDEMVERAAQEAAAQAAEQTRKLLQAMGTQQSSYRSTPNRFDSPHHHQSSTSRPINGQDHEPALKRVKKEADDDDGPLMDPTRDQAMRQKSAAEQQRAFEQQQAFEVQALIRGGGAPSGMGGGRPYSRENSRAPEDRRGGGGGGGGRDDRYAGGGGSRDYRDDRRDDRYAHEDRYGSSSRSGGGGYGDYRSSRPRSRSPPRGGGGYGSQPYERDPYRNGGGGGGGSGYRPPERRTSGEQPRYQDDRGGYGGYSGGANGSRRDEPFDRASSVASSRSRLPSGSNGRTAATPSGYNGPPPPPGFGNGYSNGYSSSQQPYGSAPGPSTTENATSAYGQRGHALADQNDLRPPPSNPYSASKTLDPRRAGK